MPRGESEHHDRMAAEAEARDLKILTMLHRGATRAEVAAEIGVSRQRVHQLIQRMRERGWVSVEPTEADGRQGQP